MNRIMAEPKLRFIAGLITVPALLFQTNLYIKICQVLLFILLSVLSGKRFRVLPNLLIAAGIIFMNLLTPLGKILFSLGNFYITEGALKAGLQKTLVLIGLIYLSRFSVTRGLSFPGELGGTLARVFYYFEEITARRGGLFSKGNGKKEGKRKRTLRLENLYTDLDCLLLTVQANTVASGEMPPSRQEAAESSMPAMPHPAGNPWAGRILLFLIVSVNWGLLLLSG